MNKRKVGKDYEKLAAAFLEKKGYQILEANYQNRYGEIDLIARDLEKKECPLVFVEVKYRSSMDYGAPTEAVNKRKQKKIIQVAWFYLKMHGYGYDTPCRFDLVTVCKNQVSHMEHAFWGYAL